MSTAPTPNLPEPVEPPTPVALRIPSNDDERMMGMLCHLGGVATTVVVPLIIWQLKKEQSKFLDDQGKESLNFQLNALGYYLVCLIISLITCGFATLIFVPVALYVAVMGIIGGLKANNGDVFRYPGTVRVIK